jgi:hypothetical protein
MRTRYLVTLLSAGSLLINGCGSLPNPHVRITFPRNGAIIPLSEGTASYVWQWTPGYITFSIDNIPQLNDSSCPYPAVLINPRDNGGTFVGLPTMPTSSNLCSSTAPSPEQSFTWKPQSLGLHTLSAQIIVITDNGNYQNYESDSVTVCVTGDPSHPPQNITLGRSSANCYPLTPTPVIPIPVHNNPNQQGPGCSQYNNQSSCDLAGCAWNPQNSTCDVSQ